MRFNLKRDGAIVVGALALLKLAEMGSHLYQRWQREDQVAFTADVRDVLATRLHVESDLVPGDHLMITACSTRYDLHRLYARATRRAAPRRETIVQWAVCEVCPSDKLVAGAVVAGRQESCGPPIATAGSEP